MPKRVLIFSLAYDPVVGGAEVAVKQITNRISDLEFDMITMRFDESHLKVEKIGNITVYRVKGGHDVISKILFVPRAVLFALRRRYDLYWAIMTNMTFPISILRILGVRTPYVLTLQDGDPFERVFKRWRIRIFKPLLVYGFKNATKVQAISNFLALWAKDLGFKDRVEVIPNGVDVKLFSESTPEIIKELQDKLEKKPNSFFLVTTSRLSAKNAISDVIKALALLPQNVHFLIIGSGELEQHLIDQARLLVVDERVKFLGFVPYENIPVYLHASDIFIRPSLSEGFGNSFIEAMAAGLPVVATPVGGIVDFIKDGETGIFVEVGNAEDIAHKVKRLMEDKNLRDKLIANGKKMVAEKYDWNFIAQEMKTRVLAKV